MEKLLVRIGSPFTSDVHWIRRISVKARPNNNKQVIKLQSLRNLQVFLARDVNGGQTSSLGRARLPAVDMKHDTATVP